jgi:serine/threonine protein kinase
MKAPLPIRTCIKWFHNLCEAVSALHSANLVHSAISLHSVFIPPATGTLKLKLPFTSLIPPSALDQYKASELLNGIRDNANDIWSSGIILVELVTSSTADAECETPQQLIQALIDSMIPAALQSVQNRVVAQCLAPYETWLTIEMVMAHPIQDIDEPAVEAQATPFEEKSLMATIISLSLYGGADHRHQKRSPASEPGYLAMKLADPVTLRRKSQNFNWPFSHPGRSLRNS